MLNNAIKTAALAGAGALAYAGEASADWYCEYVGTICEAEVHCSQNCTVTPSGSTCDEPVCELVIGDCWDIYECWEY